jgi:hypothetical protein
VEPCNGSQRRNAEMTLGRTSSGAIKIKTDEAGGGLRAVECACCGGGCDCGFATPINPPSDPDFTKRLRGDDPDVSFFASVSVQCTIGVTPSWGSSYSFSQYISGNWVDGGNCTFLGEQVLKFLQTSDCSYGGGCGSYGGCGAFPNNFIGITLLLTASGCLFFSVYEEFNFGSFRITGSSAECNSDAICPVQINGASYSTIMGQSDFGDPAFGNATITFS